MKFDVSIIIATYNSERTIKRALESVMNQTYQNWECLVIDGNSKDKTIEIVNNFVKLDSRFRYISESDNGIYDAFNKGWQKAKGKWIYYLGSDDWLEEDGLRLLMKEEDANAVILSGDTNLIRLDGSIRCLKSGLPNLGCHQGMVMLRDVIEQMKGFDEQYHIIADYDLIVRIINVGYKMKLVHVVVANFVIGGTSQALKNVPIYFKERYEINKKFLMIKNPLLSTINTVLKKSISVIIRRFFYYIKQII